MLSIESMYKVVSSYDQLLQDVERLKGILNSKAPSKKDDDLEANIAQTNDQHKVEHNENFEFRNDEEKKSLIKEDDRAD